MFEGGGVRPSNRRTIRSVLAVVRVGEVGDVDAANPVGLSYQVRWCCPLMLPVGACGSGGREEGGGKKGLKNLEDRGNICIWEGGQSPQDQK